MRFDVDAVAKAIGIPTAEWPGRCHEIACAMLRAGLVPGAGTGTTWRE